MTPPRAHGQDEQSWRRGSVGSSQVWDAARRKAHRTGASGSPAEAASGALGAAFSAAHLSEIVAHAVGSAVQDLLPDLDDEARERMDATIRARIADLLEAGKLPEPEPEASAAVPLPPPQSIPVPPEAIDPILADRIRADFQRLGAGMHALAVLRETAITLVLETLQARREECGSTSPRLSTHELRHVDNLERRIAKLTSSIAKTRAALAEIAAMQDFDPGLPSLYRQVQGLTSVDAGFRVKRELLADIFEANLKLQSDLRQLRPELDARGDARRDLDGPRHGKVA